MAVKRARLGSIGDIIGEVPSGSVNSSNTTFTTSKAYIGASLEVFINGISQARTTHFTETTPGSGVFTMGDAPLTGDIITVSYSFTVSTSGNAATVGGYSALGIFNALYPIGTIYTNTVNATNPATLLGFGTWTALTGRVIVGKAASGTFGTAGATGGAETVTLGTGEIPSHAHVMNGRSYLGGGGGTSANLTLGGGGYVQSNTDVTSSVGGGGAHNNLQPYLVAYIWQRTA